MSLWLLLASAAILPPMVHAAGTHPYLAALTDLAQGRFEQGVRAYARFVLFTGPPIGLALRRHDLAGARNFFTVRARRTPETARTQLYLALLDRIEEAWTPASERLNELRTVQPQSRLVIFLAGEFALAQGNLAEAQEHFAHLETLPDTAVFCRVAARLMARHAGIGTHASDQGRLAILTHSAERHWDLGETAAAVTLFRQAMAEFPAAPEPARGLAMLYVEERAWAEADRIIQQWEERACRTLLPPLSLARLRFGQLRYGEAAAVLEPQFQADPANELICFLLAESLFQTGRFAAALPLFKELAKQDPANIGHLQRLSLCYGQTGQITEGIAQLERLADHSPAADLVRVELACLLVEAERFEEARDLFLTLAQATDSAQTATIETPDDNSRNETIQDENELEPHNELTAYATARAAELDEFLEYQRRKRIESGGAQSICDSPHEPAQSPPIAAETATAQAAEFAAPPGFDANGAIGRADLEQVRRLMHLYR